MEESANPNEGIQEEYWTDTMLMYQKLFKKPKMTEQLLKKPPFRYLHDIFTSLSKVTGFGHGLFSSLELDSSWYQTKSDKYNFLLKLTYLIQFVLEEEI